MIRTANLLLKFAITVLQRMTIATTSAKGRALRIAGFLTVALVCAPLSARPQQAAHKPNFLIILADDMGYSDLGCYGGEVQTPNLDRLAANGLRYTQFYNTTRCWPSRAAILTGYYAQQVRRDTLPGVKIVSPPAPVVNASPAHPNPILGSKLPGVKSTVPPPAKKPVDGQGVRQRWARLLPDFLRPLGYRSYHSGKWHLDGVPLQNGFDHSYRLEDHDRYFNPHFLYEDDRPLKPIKPQTGYYATTAIADHAIKYLKDHAVHYPKQPFFEYLAFTSPHFPLQALPQDIAKYRDRFYAGWDVLRAQRLKRMQALGIVHCALSARTPGVPAWDTLSEEQKQKWRIRMALHAAMVDRMDQEIGRVIAQLKAMGAFDDTVIFFLSDNGASAEIVNRSDANDVNAEPGTSKSFLCLEPGWANLCNTPLRLSKIFVHEGGISTSLIVHWPHGLMARGQLRRNPGHLIDFVPTILELAGSKKPTSWQGQPIPRAPGCSLVPTFTRDNSVKHPFFWWSHAGNRAIRMGNWKLVAEGPDTPWELYHISVDRSEIHNLAAQHPEKARELAQAWNKHLEEFTALATKKEPNLLTGAQEPKAPKTK